MLDVVDIEFGVFVHLLIATTTHLPPARETGPYTEARPLPVGVSFHQERLFWSRPDPAHLPAHDIPELWQLVESGTPQQTADPCDPRIVIAHLKAIGGGVYAHRTELIGRKGLPMLADPTLAENRRARGVDAHRSGQHSQKGPE